MELSEQVADVVDAALREDVGHGDRTTALLVPSGHRCRAQLLLEEPGIVCGVQIAAAVFTTLDRGIEFTTHPDPRQRRVGH